MTVAIRALGTGQLGSWNRARFFRREMIVGLLNGVAFALITGTVSGFWFGNLMLGVVIALAMVATLVVAALAGVVVPLALDKAGIDPAISSGTFVTTVTDVVGFFSFLGIATILLRLG
jgi:magnesium transporter